MGLVFALAAVEIEVGDEFPLKLLRVAAADGQAAAVEEESLPASDLLIRARLTR